jgi:HIV Tat-specific factor 1
VEVEWCRKLEEWSDDDQTELEPMTKKQLKYQHMVVLKHMFTLQELEETPELLLDLNQDIREECSKLGTVTNVIVYDQTPDGVCVVRFKDTASAALCAQRMNGRFFAGRIIEAAVYDGEEKYSKSKADVEQDEERLDKFTQWLEEH